jgi:hypothetical protein
MNPENREQRMNPEMNPGNCASSSLKYHNPAPGNRAELSQPCTLGTVRTSSFSKAALVSVLFNWRSGNLKTKKFTVDQQMKTLGFMMVQYQQIIMLRAIMAQYQQMKMLGKPFLCLTGLQRTLLYI